MSNALHATRKKVSIALKVVTVAKLDKRASLDGTSRAQVAEYYLSAALEKLQLSEAEMAKVKAEIEANRHKRARG